jgi:hypothetical protein
MLRNVRFDALVYSLEQSMIVLNYNMHSSCVPLLPLRRRDPLRNVADVLVT